MGIELDYAEVYMSIKEDSKVCTANSNALIIAPARVIKTNIAT
jgi:hypothetical protein